MEAEEGKSEKVEIQGRRWVTIKVKIVEGKIMMEIEA